MDLKIRGERRFANAVFGPWRLRHVLHRLMDPDEKLIGWGVVQPGSSAWAVFSSAAMAMVPGVGSILGAMSSSNLARRRRVAVLTSKRLILIRADARRLDTRAVTFNEPLSLIEMESQGAGSGREATFILHFGSDQPAVFELAAGSRGSADRLREGFLSLCGHDEPM